MATFWAFHNTTSNPTGLLGIVGGDITGSLIQGNLNELFSHVDAPPSGVTDESFQYRKLHIKNVSSFTLSGVKIWIDAVEHTDQIFVGLPVDATPTSITSPTGTAPGSVVFSRPVNYTGGLDAGIFAAGYSTGLWMRQGLSGIHEPDPYGTYRVNVGGIEQ